MIAPCCTKTPVAIRKKRSISAPYCAVQNLQTLGLRSQGDFLINFVKAAPMPLNGALHNLQRGADGR